MKQIEVNISQCLSSTGIIEVPDNFDETDNIALEEIVKKQIYLPQDLINDKILSDKWVIDDFCVV